MKRKRITSLAGGVAAAGGVLVGVWLGLAILSQALLAGLFAGLGNWIAGTVMDRRSKQLR